MKFKKHLLALVATLALGAQATEFRSADTHNADDYTTVVAVKHMSELLEKASGGNKFHVYSLCETAPVPLPNPDCRGAARLCKVLDK